MSERASALASVVVATVVGTGAMGSGGEDAWALLFHQTALAAVVAVLVWREPGALLRRLPASLLLLGFLAASWLVAPYRYRALLLLTNIAAAALLWRLARSSARTPGGRLQVTGGLLLAGALPALVVLCEAALGLDPHGMFHNPRHASAIVTALVGALGAAVVVTGRELRWRYAVALVPALLAVVLLASRASLLGLGVAGLATIFATRRLRLLVPLAAALGLLLLAPSPLSRRVAGAVQDPYAFERLRMWAMTLRMARDAPMLGVGVGSFPRVARRYNFPVEHAIGRYAKYANFAHSAPLELLAESGPAGLLLLLWPASVALRRAFAIARSEDPLSPLATAAATAFATLLAHAAVDAVLHAPANLYALAACGGLAAGLGRPARVADPSAPGVRALRGPFLVVWVSLWAGVCLWPWRADRSFSRFRSNHDPAELSRAMRLAPGHAGYRRVAGNEAAERFARTGELSWFATAHAAFEAAARLDPLEVEHRRTLAGFELAAVLGKLPARELAERSLGNYRRAIAMDPFNPFLAAENARLLGLLDRGAEAEAELLRATSAEPRFRAGWLLLARSRAARGDAPGAREATARAAAIEERFRGALAGASPYERALLAALPVSRPEAAAAP